MDAEIQRRAQALAILEDNAEQIVGADDEDGYDELDHADRAARDGHEGLAGRVAARDSKWQELDRVAPFVRVQPPSVLKGITGNQAVVAPGQIFQVANWSGDDAETQPVTVTFGAVQPPIPVNAHTSWYDYRPYGRVKFGNRGALLQVDVDIGSGCSFSVSGSSIVLMVGIDIPSTTSPLHSATPEPLTLTGMISAFAPGGGRSAPITRSLFVDSTTPAKFAVPLFGRRVQLWKSDPTQDVHLTFFSSNNQGVGFVDIPASSQQSAPILLPGNTLSVQPVDPADGFSSIQGVLVFELAL